MSIKDNKVVEDTPVELANGHLAVVNSSMATLEEENMTMTFQYVVLSALKFLLRQFIIERLPNESR